MTSYLLSYTSIPFRKGVYSKRKEFAPMGSKFFLFRIDPSSKGLKREANNLDRVVSPESVSVLLKSLDIQCMYSRIRRRVAELGLFFHMPR